MTWSSKINSDEIFIIFAEKNKKKKMQKYTVKNH